VLFGPTGIEKRLPFLHYLYPPWQGRKTKRCRVVLASCLEEARKDGGFVLNIGSGSRRYGDHVLNIELTVLPDIDLLAAAESLPFRDESVVGVILEHVLEHVQNPDVVIGEIRRVLGPHGWLYVETPFMVPYHEGPYDFRRWTLTGLRQLAGKSFTEEAAGVSMGPGTALMHLTREALAAGLAFNSLLIYRTVRVMIGWLTLWLKFMDILLLRGDQFGHIGAAGVFALFRINKGTMASGIKK